MTDQKETTVVSVPSELARSIPAAVTRASYLFPDLSFVAEKHGISVDGMSPNERSSIEKEISYILYREHIRQQYEPFRRKALSILYGVPK